MRIKHELFGRDILEFWRLGVVYEDVENHATMQRLEIPIFVAIY